MFKKNRYAVIRNAISKDLALFIYNYILMKKQVYDTCLEARYISPFETILGHYENDHEQIPNTFSFYSDVVAETLMLKCQPIMEKTTGLKLFPAYTYGRVYKKGDELKKHKDRFSCEISTTMNIGGDKWPIYLEPNPTIGHFENGVYQRSKSKGIKVDLNPGDMLVYRGCDLEHWRNKFKGKENVQIFLHYNNQKTANAKLNIFDRRQHLGLPSWFKK